VSKFGNKQKENQSIFMSREKVKIYSTDVQRVMNEEKVRVSKTKY